MFSEKGKMKSWQTDVSWQQCWTRARFVLILSFHIPSRYVALKWGRYLDFIKCTSTKSKSFTCRTVLFFCLRLTVYLFVSDLSLLFSLQSLLFLTTSPVSGVLDSRCSDQWAHVVLGSMPLLKHQSCTNLRNSPPWAQPHQSYPHRMGSVSLTRTHSLQSQVFGRWKSVLYAGCLSWMWPIHHEAVSSSYSWHFSICWMLIAQ